MSSSNSSSPISLLSFVDGLWDSAKVAKVIYFTLCFDVLYFWLKGNGLFGIKMGKEFDLSLLKTVVKKKPAHSNKTQNVRLKSKPYAPDC
ncbi:hypothetical protein [Dickeya fangzhongdai]